MASPLLSAMAVVSPLASVVPLGCELDDEHPTAKTAHVAKTTETLDGFMVGS